VLRILGKHLDLATAPKVLDIGAGQGALSVRLKDAGARVSACDVVPEQFDVPGVEFRAVTSDGRLPANVRFVDERPSLAGEFRYEDLVAAADVVITKPGYGIIAECIANGTALLYTSRGIFREYDVLVRDMPRYLRSRFIDQGELFAGRWRGPLEALMAQAAPPETIATNGAEVAAYQHR